MHDALEIEPIDADVMEEIQLIVNLMIAAATTRERLNTPSIDQALGVDPAGTVDAA
jgi:hypothetical protein